MDEMDNPLKKEWEDFCGARHQFLVECEPDSLLVQILKEVSFDADPSKIVGVLKKYDSAAEKAIPDYWINRLDEWNVYLARLGQPTFAHLCSRDIKEVKIFLSANPQTNCSGFEAYLDSNLYAKSQVEFLERCFSGMGEDAMKMPFF